MSESSGRVLPIYMVADESRSMTPVVDELNAGLRSLHDALLREPMAAAKVRFSILGFSDDVIVHSALVDLRVTSALPQLSVRGGTSYGAAFSLLLDRIPADVRALKREGFAVHRPAVFFLSDGAPTDDEAEWRAAFAELTDYDRQTRTGFAMYPNMIPFGVDNADPKVMQQLIHPATGAKQMRMFLMDKGNDPAEAIRAMAEIMISSVLSSGMGVAGGASGVVLPDPSQLPSGVSSFASDDDDFL